MDPASHLADLPEDLLYNILPHLPLKSLIAARGVCRAWCHAIEIADIHPIRRSLLEVYLEAINATWFLASRPWPLEELRSFDRQAYLDTLLGQYNWLPEEFSMWILEWPALAVAAWQWPGLPADDFSGIFTIHRRSGMNTLGIMPPIIGTVTLATPLAGPDSDSDSDSEEPYITENVPAVLVWEDCWEYQVWLLLAGKGYKGKVVLTPDCTVIYTHYDEMDGMFIADDWTSWMRRQHECLAEAGGYLLATDSLDRNLKRAKLEFTPWMDISAQSCTGSEAVVKEFEA